MSREHALDPGAIHHDWDNSREAVLRIRSGDLINLELLKAGHGPPIPEFGLLPDDFPEAYLKIWDLRDGRRARLTAGVSTRSSTRASGTWA